MATQKRNISSSKSKSLSKTNKVSSSRKHLIKSRKSGTQTRKMRGGSEKPIDGPQKKPRKTFASKVSGWFGRKPVESVNLGKKLGIQTLNVDAQPKKQPMSANTMFKLHEVREKIGDQLSWVRNTRGLQPETKPEIEVRAQKLMNKGFTPETYAAYLQEREEH